ncbi:MAG: FAD-dependent oxidoreductase, partial [Slackia sp.]|nr:FAD-dependent oxidoreductase [Slackia sp.]
MREVDVAIVGAGVAGCCVARECARFALKVAVFEAGLDVADG